MRHVHTGFLRCFLFAFASSSVFSRAGDLPPLPPMEHGAPAVRVIATDPTALEGGSTGAFTFVSDVLSTNDLVLRVNYSGTASNGVDYQSLTNVLTLPAGQLAIDLLVRPLPEVLVGHDRTVTVTLEPSAGYTLGAHKSATVTIVENRFHALPPTVRITEPTNGAALHTAVLSISAEAMDQAAKLTQVVFYSGDRLLKTFTKPPYLWTWTNVPAGGHTLRAWAEDSLGNWSQSDPVSVVITNGLPAVNLLTPTNLTVIHGPTAVTLVAQAFDGDAPIVRVDFLANNHPLGSVTMPDSNGLFALNLADIGVGKFEIRARVVDQLRREALSDAAILNVTNAPPSVSVFSPKMGASFGVSNQITFAARVADTDDSVVKVEFAAGDLKIGHTTNAPWSVVYTNLPPGHYSVRARATDSAGLSTWSSGVNLTVTNIPPTIVLSSPTNQASFTVGSTIELTAIPTVLDGGAKSVTFYANDRFLGTVDAAPFTLGWTKVKPGTYKLRAALLTTYGVSANSSVVTIKVTN